MDKKRFNARSKIYDMEATLENARHDFLRKSGWQYYSCNPGHTWWWEKKLPDGRTVLVQRDVEAFSMQEDMDLEEDE